MTASSASLPPLRTTQVVIPEGKIDLGIGQPTLSLLPIDAVRQAAEHRLNPGNREVLAYGADQGDGFFRNALSQFLTRRYEMPVHHDELFVTASASQALDLVCTRFTKPGDTIFVEEPTYFLALLVFRDHGLNVVGVPIDADGVRIDALTALLAQHKPVFFYTIPTFQNPSAATLSAERRERLVALSRQHNFLIVADEVYHLLNFGSVPPAPLAKYLDSGRVISLGSFSKIAAPGLRLGWVQSSREILNTLIASGIVESGGGLNPFASGIVQSLIELGLLDSWLDHLRAVYQERSAAICAALREHLPHAWFAEPKGGFFVWLQLPDGKTVDDIAEHAAQLGVGYQRGSRFGNNAELARYVRLSFAYYDSPDLREGVKRLARAF
ncbi:MAG: PLP-dependent aminotransferase family protein [Gemmatimonadaceae bacterium]